MNSTSLAWLSLFLASILEIGWPLGFKLSQTTAYRWPWLSFSILSIGCSGYLLWRAQQSIPIGTAYAVWSGIGAAGTFAIGVMFFGDSVSLLRILSFLLIVAGVIGLKLSAG